MVRNTRGPAPGVVQEYYLTKKFESTPTDPILLNGLDGNFGYAAYNRLLDQNNRAVLSDFRPDPRTMESDQARDTRSYAVQMLNHRFHGTRSGQDPDMPEIFTELTDLDPRGTATDPDYNQIRRQAWAREERTRQNLYPEGPDFTTSGGWAPESVQQDKISMRDQTRQRMRYFFPEELQEGLGPRRQFTFAERPYANRPLAEQARPTLGADSLFGSRMGGARARHNDKKNEWSELDSRTVNPEGGENFGSSRVGRHNRRNNARGAREHMLVTADSTEDTSGRLSSQVSMGGGRTARQQARRPGQEYTGFDNYSRAGDLNDGFEPRGRGQTARHQDNRMIAGMTTSTAYTRNAMHETTGNPHGASARHQDGRRAAEYLDADAPDVQHRVGSGERVGRRAMTRSAAGRSTTAIGMESQMSGTASRVGDRETMQSKRRGRTQDTTHRKENMVADVRDKTRVSHAYTRLHANPAFRPCREALEETNWNDLDESKKASDVHGGANGLMSRKNKARFGALKDSEPIAF